jgi:hypothetical protein
VTPADRPAPRAVPGTLRVAAVLTALEALAFTAYGVLLLPDLFSAHAEAGGTAAVFFLLYAVFLAVCVRQLWRLRSWTRAPLVLAQLIQLFVGTSFWGGQTTVVAVVLVAVAVVVLVALLHPRSLAALGAG